MKPAVKQLFYIAISTLILTSCPQPLTKMVMNSAKDLIPPEIIILSPTDYSSFSRTVQVQGTVTDLSDDSGLSGRVESLSWEILAQTVPAETIVNPDGSFLVEYDTTLTENIVISLNAIDWNGNSSELRLPLVYTGNDIPTLSIEPGNRQVVLTWDDVPGVETYTIYMESSALAPTVDSVNRLNNVTSPYTIDNLKDGTIYSLLLHGSSATGPDNFSSVVRGIPLSTFHLFPRVETTFNHIQVDWPALDGINTYEVMRSGNPDGPFSSVSGPISGTTYKDWNVQQGKIYYYGVKPAEYCDIISETAEGRLHPFPPYRDAEVAHYMTPEYPKSSEIKGQYLFIADYYNGLHVADITVPSVPLPVTTLNLPSGASDLVISGNTAYVTGGSSLYVVDITDPVNPSLSGSVVVTSSQAEGVDVQGSLVSVACFNDGFSLVDVSNPTNPILSRHENKTGGIYDLGQAYNSELRTIGSYLYLFISNNSSTAIYRIAGTPASPILYARSNSMMSSDEIAISEDGSYAYIASSWYLRTYNLSSLYSPTLLDTLDPSPDEPVEGIAVSGDRAYITMRDVGFAIVDITYPNNLSEMIVYNTPGEAKSVALSEGYAYISDGQGYGLHIYGIAEPQIPTLLDTYTGLTEPTDLAIQGDYLFVTETSNDWEMSVLNISNPANLISAGGATSYTPVGMKVVGQKIFFAAERSGTMMFDISDPVAPSVLPPWYVSVQGGYALELDVFGRYSTVVTNGSMLNVFDLSWDENISAAGALSIGGGAQPAVDVVYKGDYAFIANTGDGFRVVDLSNPKWPAAVSTFVAAEGSTAALEIVGDLAYVATTGAGLHIYDISNPQSVSVVFGPSSGNGAKDVVVSGDYAIMAQGSSGIEIYNVSNPSSPTLIRGYAGITADKILLSGDILYALDYTGGKLNVLDLLP